MLVANDINLVERSLLTFADTYLEVHGVAHHICFYRDDAVEHISVVVVLIGDGVIVSLAHVGAKALGEQFLIVDIAILELQRLGERIGGIDGVAHPVDIAHIVLATLVNGEIHVYVLLIKRHHAVGHDKRVAVTP